MTRRRYAHYCAFATALDAVGDRWTLLVVRELLGGPRRYTDLADGLPGIGSNMLADRLKHLESLGLVAKARLPPPGTASVYVLTEAGEELREPVYGLARFGTRFLGPPDTPEPARPHWLALGLLAVADPSAAPGIDDTYEFRVAGDVFHIVVSSDRLAVEDGPAEDPDAVFEGDARYFLAVPAGYELGPDAVSAGHVRIKGDPAAVARAASVFSRFTA